MVKGVTLAFYGLSLLLLGLFSGDAMRVEMDVASEVVAGEEFEVTVHVTKGDMESFARYTADIPRGLTVVRGQAENAAFDFEGQRVRFVWLRLPQSESFDVKYTVSVDERLRGAFSLGGEMQYIVDNQRRVASVKTSNINIRPSAQVAPERQLDIDAYQQSIPAQRRLDMQNLRVRCIRERPSLLGEGNDLGVRLLVNRGEAQKFAKIEEQIPAGFGAEPIETKDAIFSFEDGVVKFLWMTLPTEPMFTVSYRLIPEGAVTGLPAVRGTFSFVQNEATRTIGITQRDATLKGLSNEELERVVRTAPVVSGAGGYSGGGTLEPQGESEGGFPIAVRYRELPASRPGGSSRRQAVPSMDAYQLVPEEGVYYRVQVAAGHRPINIDRYFRRLALHADVRTERHEGWYKYSVGSFKEYRAARDYRVEVWNTTPIRDAFVAAYNNGKRITVQEALMITSQKWYR